MKRALASLAGLGLVLVIGCVQEYDFRMGKTIENKRYQKRLNDNLEGAPAKTNLQTGNIFVRPPKGLQGPHKTFGLAVLEAGKFDLEDTFADPQKQASLHLLARVTLPKPPGKKGSSPAETTQRGDFTDDVLELLKNAYGAEFEKTRLKNEEKKSPNGRTNAFKSLTQELPATAKEIKVYIFGEKNSPEKVALIFDYPKEEARTLSSKINLCLESFAVGPAATRSFAGAGDEEFGGELGGGGGTPAPGGVF
jgi:hypothetical protein